MLKNNRDIEPVYTLKVLDKQQHTRRLKPLKPVLNPTLYQFILWITNQKWGYDYSASRGRNYKLWMRKTLI